MASPSKIFAGKIITIIATYISEKGIRLQECEGLVVNDRAS
ncbi:predicted protein [Sclerotinia sclerotiorum 1980 UF-70]|uniref:Uncharacterized protein n=1 Tax=Sclerotinia sclerotiorum (strain ATCC 18683 / 1980 / Ss-1) TaxID=665079 RepID=A7EHU0_SCLS1|nr:predicted protein [Sclerotinia sclerotiorum 1980 UF-70]EDO02406.1 predicted protein [Sclerotinia sclerotiorum 1980 UF-70]